MSIVGEYYDDDCRITVRYVDRPILVKRPDTIGNRAGDYVAKIIDGSVELASGLLKKLKLKNVGI